MTQIHPSAIIGEHVEIGEGTIIESAVMIEDHVKIGANNHIRTRAFLGRGTTLGDGNQIHMGAVVGHEPQDLAFEAATESFTRIGNENIIREYVTIHRGTKSQSETVIGDRNYLMALSHVAHNCRLGNDIVIVNQSSLAGYCEVGDRAFISGFVGMHQFTRVGSLAIVSGLSAMNKDVPPFFMCGGRPARAQGINLIGLKRAGIHVETRREIKQAFKYLYRESLPLSKAIEKIRTELKSDEANKIAEFIVASKRGIVSWRPSGEQEDRDSFQTENQE